MELRLPRLIGYFRSPDRIIELGLCLSYVVCFSWNHPPYSATILIIAAVLTYIRLDIAIGLLPLTFPFYTKVEALSASGFPWFVAPPEIGLLICLGAVVLRHVFRPDERRATQQWLAGFWQQARPFLLPAMLFLLGASLALLASPDLHNSLRAYRWEIIEPLLYFVLILRYIRTSTDLARTIGALILAGLAAACFGIIAGFLRIPLYIDVVSATTFRIGGPYGNPNALAFMMERTMPILLALVFLGIRRRPADDPVSQREVWRDPLRWVCLVLLLPLAWALFWTDSRGAEVGILVVMLCFFVIEIRSKLALLVMGGAGVLGIVVFWPKILAFVNEPTHGATSERLYGWKAALLMIRDHFLLGIGPDSFLTLYRPSAPNSYLLQALNGQPVGTFSPTLPHPHNLILDFWLSIGLLGLVAVFWLLGAFAKVAARTYRRCADLPHGGLFQRLLLGIAGAMLASFIHGMVDSFYFHVDQAMIFWLFLGLLLVIRLMVQQADATLHVEVRRESEEVLSA